MLMLKSLTMAVILLVSAGKSHADTTDRDAILAVTQRLFDAVRSGDPDEWRAVLREESTLISLRSPTDGAPQSVDVRQFSSEQFIAALRASDRDRVERWTEEPTVLIRGPMALVWGAFDFHLDGELSHCGVNAIDLVKIDGDWKVAHLMWTTELENCQTLSR